MDMLYKLISAVNHSQWPLLQKFTLNFIIDALKKNYCNLIV